MSSLTRLSNALLVTVLLSGTALAAPEAAEKQGESIASSTTLGSPTANDAAPTLVDDTPTIELSQPQAGAQVSGTSNPVVDAAALSPDRCAIAVELPADGAKVGGPPLPAPGEDPACTKLVDAVPIMVTPAGATPIAGGDGSAVTEQELLLRLGKRRGDLDAEKAALDQQALLLDAAATRIQERTARLEELQASIDALVGARDEQSQEEIAAMVSLYQNMKPKDAAAVMSGLPDDVLLRIASNMSPRKMSPIVAAMAPARAQGLTVLMMEKANEPRL